MANEKNLIPFNELTESKHREIAQKGGRASVAARRQKKLMKSLVREFLNSPVPRSNERKLKAAGFSEDEFTNSARIVLSMFNQAIKGNVRAAEFLRDMAGENPQLEFKRELMDAKKFGKDDSSVMLRLVETLQSP